MRVFLVDDAKCIRTRIRLLVEEMGAVVVGEARNQKDAIKGILDVHPDVVVIDLRLANGTGMDVLKHVKKHWQEMVFIILTNYQKEEYQIPCLEAGADYFLEKTRQFTEFELLLRELHVGLFNKQKRGYGFDSK